MRIHYHNFNLREPVESGVHARGLLKALRARGHELLVCPADEGPEAGASLSLAKRIFARLPAAVRDRYSIWTARRRLRREGPGLRERLASFRPDVIYARTHYSNLLILEVVRAYPEIPLVVEVNGIIGEELRAIGRNRLARFAGDIERRLWREARAIRVVSSELREMLAEQGVDRNKTRVIPSGTDVEAFTGAAEAAAERARFGFTPGEVVFGYVGSFRFFHGLGDLLDLAKALTREGAPARFLMVGDGPERPAFERRAREAGLSGRFVFAGLVKHEAMPAAMAAMDVGLSLYPPGQRVYFCPLKLLEYLAAGKAVLASNVGPQGEMLRHGETGWLVPVGDSAALLEGARALGTGADLRRRLGQAGARLVREEYTWDHTAQRLERVFEEVSRPSGA